MTILTILALATLFIWLLLAMDILRGNRSVVSLRDISPTAPDLAPRVSIIVAARNEERHLRLALESLRGLTYPNYELLVVDDRSDDATGAILDEVAAGDSRLTVIHVTELPSGWLGKNHALWLGAQRASGELLLFTDADVIMEPTALSRAVNLLECKRIDHLALTPAMTMPTTLLQMFGTTFIVFFSIFSRPWKARDPKSPYHIGIGAFNLLRATSYDAVGGHERIRLRPDDDLKLGKIVKLGGFRSDVAFAPDFLSVEWYASLGEVIRGLEKNAFAGCDYRIALPLFGGAFHLMVTVWPYLAMLVTHGVTRFLNIAVVLVLTAIFMDCASFHRGRRWQAIGFPLGTLLFVWIVLRTMVKNLWQGGISWRGTFYSLRELKGNRV